MMDPGATQARLFEPRFLLTRSVRPGIKLLILNTGGFLIITLLVVVATTALINAAVAGSLRQDALHDAYTAYQDHDYKTAFQKFKMLAERGDLAAQDSLTDWAFPRVRLKV
jgi:hypothetical protein